MNAQFLKAFLRTGNSATVTKVTGTACPCMTSRDSAHPQYSAQWHRDHPASADCAKTGLINRTSEQIPIKGMYRAADISGNLVNLGAILKVAIGEVKKGDLIWQGSVRTDTSEFYSLAGLSPIADKITINGSDYILDMCRNEYLDDELIYEIALLRKVA